MASTIPFVWSNDDIQFGQADKLQRMVDFLSDFEIPGTFFVIPGADQRGLSQDKALLKTIEKARAKGHDFYQHGYVHTAFESGVPATWMLDFAPQVRRQYDDCRLEIEAGHTLENMVRMLENGQREWRAAFGENSPGYRPGWGALCTNLYKALDVLGYQWVSSTCPLRTSWMWNQLAWEYPVDLPEDTARLGPYRIGHLWEFPIGGDYAFRVPNEPRRIEQMVELALTEISYLHSHQIPMTMVSHPHGLTRNDDSGYAVHAKLLPRLLESGKVEPMTLGQLHQCVHAKSQQHPEPNRPEQVHAAAQPR